MQTTKIKNPEKCKILREVELRHEAKLKQKSILVTIGNRNTSSLSLKMNKQEVAIMLQLCFSVRMKGDQSVQIEKLLGYP